MPRSLRGRIALLVVVTLLPFCASAQSDVYREWVHYMNSGGWASPDRECQLRFIEERRYKLIRNEVDGEPPIGIFASVLHGRWIRGKPGSCRHPELGAQDIFGRARTWSIDLVQKAKGTFSVQAKFGDCRGDGCNAPDLFKGAFSTTLIHSGDELRDQGDPTLDKGSLVFKPLADAQRQTYALVKQFLERWTAMRTTQSLSDFAKRNTDPRIGVPLEEVTKVLERYRALSLSDTHAGFEIMEAYMLAPGPDAAPAEPLLFLQVANRRSDGRRLPETFELTQGDGIWRLSNLRY